MEAYHGCLLALLVGGVDAGELKFFDLGDESLDHNFAPAEIVTSSLVWQVIDHLFLFLFLLHSRNGSSEN